MILLFPVASEGQRMGRVRMGRVRMGRPRQAAAQAGLTHNV